MALPYMNTCTYLQENNFEHVLGVFANVDKEIVQHDNKIPFIRAQMAVQASYPVNKKQRRGIHTNSKDGNPIGTYTPKCFCQLRCTLEQDVIHKLCKYATNSTSEHVQPCAFTRLVVYDTRSGQGFISAPICIYALVRVVKSAVHKQPPPNSLLLSLQPRALMSWTLSQLLALVSNCSCGSLVQHVSLIHASTACAPYRLLNKPTMGLHISHMLHEQSWDSYGFLLHCYYNKCPPKHVVDMATRSWALIYSDQTSKHALRNAGANTQLIHDFTSLAVLMCCGGDSTSNTRSGERQRVEWLAIEYKRILDMISPESLLYLLNCWGDGVLVQDSDHPSLYVDRPDQTAPKRQRGKSRQRSGKTPTTDHKFNHAVQMDKTELQRMTVHWTQYTRTTPPPLTIGIHEPSAPFSYCIPTNGILTTGKLKGGSLKPNSIVGILSSCHSYSKIRNMLDPLVQHQLAVVSKNNSIVVPLTFLYRFLPTYAYANLLYYRLPGLVRQFCVDAPSSWHVSGFRQWLQEASVLLCTSSVFTDSRRVVNIVE
jgi:hypothetical protein